MSRLSKFVFSVCFLSVFILNAQKKDLLTYYLPQDVTYNKSIPTPESVIGHPVGKWHVTHDKLVMYMKALAESSDRIILEDRGKTFEDRPLLLLTITSPRNHQNIENIRKEHVALTESSGQNAAVSNMPIVVYQGFSIHGNEASGSNAALLLAYYLAAAEGTEVYDLLNNTVILLDPSFNPDGLQRFAGWVNMHKSEHLISDPQDREYDEAWPRGRTNHYWFDMNRDWLPVQLPESRARIKTFHRWMPNILTDHHEMGTNSSFFFQPGIPSRTHPLTPQMNQDLTKEIATYHAKAFDKIGSLYYTEESFDDFYYGKGSTFPDINGSIGILFEQGSARGHLQESENGLLTFPFAIRNQFTAALSTLEAAKNMRTSILRYQQQFYVNARKEASEIKSRAYVFGDEKDAAKAYHLAEMLKRHKITVHEVKNDFTQNGKTYKKGASYVVPRNQRQSRLINAIFEKRTQFQDSLFYDISAWTLPLAFNLSYDNLSSLSNAGNEINELKMPTGTLKGSGNYAYVFEWNEYYSPKALALIKAKKLRAKVAMKPFTLEGTRYDYGTIMIPVQNQRLSAQEMKQFLSYVAKESHLDITAVSSGLTEGIDLGSNNFEAINEPKIAMLVGDGITSYDAGEIWHLFDQRYEIPLTKLDTRRFGRMNLEKYTHLILPNTYSLPNDITQKLKTWVKNGGTLIAYRNAVNYVSRNKFISLDIKKTGIDAKNVSFEQRRDHNGAQVIGGAIFNTKIDRSHPINFGYLHDELPMFRNTTVFINPNEKSYNNPIQYTNKPLLSGYVSEENLEHLKNSVPFQTSRMGSGRVIVFTDNTNFRAFWYGTNKLLMNAIFFSGMM
ncbi:M14 family metallopeptidase [Kordia algicida OT-1]|uniref:Secreted protein containing N-terminal Zinc-dependent carboxypeptidase related domain n=1 Tax=Kordia algicida OT-1 TaxID=391587 RepID=A9EBJ4_9FLAO|nr:M14 family metallopeptidase [Kordia algicida]EDP94481.1 Secreted protein containing N-terminal Zinc-dependent carboxypeptidase related domain [Kordia algicida OT-1]